MIQRRSYNSSYPTIRGTRRYFTKTGIILMIVGFYTALAGWIADDSIGALHHVLLIAGGISFGIGTQRHAND
jgi:hypothetical protein